MVKEAILIKSVVVHVISTLHYGNTMVRSISKAYQMNDNILRYIEVGHIDILCWVDIYRICVLTSRYENPVSEGHFQYIQELTFLGVMKNSKICSRQLHLYLDTC